MADYQGKYTGAKVDEAIGKALEDHDKVSALQQKVTELEKNGVSGGGNSGEGVSTLMTNVTLLELFLLKNAGKLIKGMQYRITDYDGNLQEQEESNARLIVERPLFISAGHNFDIIVVADDEHTINSNARAAVHEGDDYFEWAGLNKWELKFVLHEDCGISLKMQGADGELNSLPAYDVMYDDTYEGFPYVIKMIGGPDIFVKELKSGTIGFAIAPDTPSAQGVDIVEDYPNVNNLIPLPIAELKMITYGEHFIQYMKDENGNSAHYDFKNIKFLKYRVTSINGEDVGNAEWYAIPSTNVQCDEENYIYAYTFDNFGRDASLPGWGSLYSLCFSNTLGIESFCNTFINRETEKGVRQQYICYSNVIGLGSGLNSFGNSCTKISIAPECTYNFFADNCTNIVLRDRSDENIFGIYCDSIELSAYCDNNLFGSFSFSIRLGEKCHDNFFKENCESIDFRGDCYDNEIDGINIKFDYSCFSNIITDYCESINFGHNCYENSLNSCCSVTFGDLCIGNEFGDWGNVSVGDNCYHIGEGVKQSGVENIVIDSFVGYIDIQSSQTVNYIKKVRNIHVKSGVSGTYNSRKVLNISTVDNPFVTTFGNANDVTINV